MPDAPGPLDIRVDKELCMGSGMCIMYASNTFGYDSQTKAKVVDPGGDLIESIRVAVEACPTGALSLGDEREGM